MTTSGTTGGLPGIDGFRGEDCLDPATLGLFAEGKLRPQERQTASSHLLACPYCVKQLNDMMEMLYYERLPMKLPLRFYGRLKRLCPEERKKKPKRRRGLQLVASLKALAATLSGRWRYGAVGLIASCAVIICLYVFLKPSTPSGIPLIDARSFVRVQALDDAGGVMGATNGVVVNPAGLIASSLHFLAGASTIRITLSDGRTFQTANVWRDEDRDLAVMKIDNESLPSMPVADISRVAVGETVFLVTDRFPADGRVRESAVRAVSAMPGRRSDRPMRYIQLVTLREKGSRGAIIDKQGRLVGLVTTGEKSINLAVPVGDAGQIAAEGRAIPVAELKGMKFSQGALDLYMKGILARDAELWDEAIDCLKKALSQNPNLFGARMELAYAYYKKGLPDLEAAEYEEALKIEPENADALFSFAMCLQMKGEYNAAIGKYEKIVAANPKDAEAQYQIGLAQLAQGNKKKAMAAYDRLKALDAGSAEMLRRLIGRQN